MTEQEWLEATDPTWMLEFLRGKPIERKLRLFAVACCRRVWHVFSDERCREAVNAAEHFADGLITWQNVKTASEQAWASRSSTWESREQGAVAAWTAREIIDPEIIIVMIHAEVLVKEHQKPAQSILLRCIFGNSFRSVVLDPAWLTWHNGLLVSMARQMYESLSV